MLISRHDGMRMIQGWHDTAPYVRSDPLRPDRDGNTVVSRSVLRELAGRAHLRGVNGFTYGLMHAADANTAPETGESFPRWQNNGQAQEHRLNSHSDLIPKSGINGIAARSSGSHDLGRSERHHVHQWRDATLRCWDPRGSCRNQIVRNTSADRVTRRAW